MKNKLKYLIAILITWATPVLVWAQESGSPSGAGDSTSSATGGAAGLRTLANTYYDQAVQIAFPIAVIVLIFAGYKYITSAGNPETLGEAKAMISGALIGLLLLLLAGLFVRTIGFQTPIS